MNKPSRDKRRSAREVKRSTAVGDMSMFDDDFPPLSMSMFASVADYEAELARQANKTPKENEGN